MKRILIFLSPFILMLGYGCLKGNNDNTATYAPIGTFSGQFTRIHYSNTKKLYDTVKANLILVMDLTTGYSITGDTTRHAGSYGGFATSTTNITFYDNNTSNSAKTHLNGTYSYTYDNVNLQIQASSDTLKYLYVLKQQ